jgi:hypothetical protein
MCCNSLLWLGVIHSTNIEVRGEGMPSKNKNARLSKPYKLFKPIKKSKAVLVQINRSNIEYMSPGWVVAIAEWRSA